MSGWVSPTQRGGGGRLAEFRGQGAVAQCRKGAKAFRLKAGLGARMALRCSCGCRGPLRFPPVPPVKTGKLTGEVVPARAWQLKGSLAAGLSEGSEIREKRRRGMLPPNFAYAGDGFLLPVASSGKVAGGNAPPRRAAVQRNVAGSMTPGSQRHGPHPCGRGRTLSEGVKRIARCGVLPRVSDGHGQAATFLWIAGAELGAWGVPGSAGGFGQPHRGLCGPPFLPVSSWRARMWSCRLMPAILSGTD
jgi:hypothetical protein